MISYKNVIVKQTTTPKQEGKNMIKVRVRDELWQDNETGEVITATQAISEFYKANAWDAQWTNYYTFTGLYSDTTIDAPDFTKAVNE